MRWSLRSLNWWRHISCSAALQWKRWEPHPLLLLQLQEPLQLLSLLPHTRQKATLTATNYPTSHSQVTTWLLPKTQLKQSFPDGSPDQEKKPVALLMISVNASFSMFSVQSPFKNRRVFGSGRGKRRLSSEDGEEQRGGKRAKMDPDVSVLALSPVQ